MLSTDKRRVLADRCRVRELDGAFGQTDVPGHRKQIDRGRRGFGGDSPEGGAFGDSLRTEPKERRDRLPTPAHLVALLDGLDTDSEHRPESLAPTDESEPVAAGEGAGRRSHRLECDIFLVLGREDLRVTVTLEQIHTDSAWVPALARDRARD